MSEWRPIETAPETNFEPVLLLLPDGREIIGHWQDGDEIPTEAGEIWWPSAWYDENFEALKPQPTHWKPLESQHG